MANEEMVRNCWNEIAINNMTFPSLQKSKRRRIPTKHFNLENEEDSQEWRSQLQHALKLSRIDTKREHYSIPSGKTYYPTIDEFRNPLRYISR